MKKINNGFSLDALANKARLNKDEMKAVKGGFSCYCHGTYKFETNDAQKCWDAC